jgi:Na+/melibiose symporter-like transporter
MTQTSISPRAQRLTVGEKVGYLLGDPAANFVFQLLIVFQLSFYTETFGRIASAAALLLLVARCADAFFGPLFGIPADRTISRWGKFRPWVLAAAVPYCIMAVVAFSNPNFRYAGQLAYAYVTYLLLMLVHSANSLPYSALGRVMTGDLGERTSLYASIPFFLGVGCLFFYRINKAMNVRITGELAARRATVAAAPIVPAIPELDPPSMAMAEAP